MTKRWETQIVKLGSVQVGGQNKIVIQSMTSTKTKNINETLEQINALFNEGAEIVRVAVLDQEDADALKIVVEKSPCPIVADIHFNGSFALKAMDQGVTKIRLNPGNISDPKMLEAIINKAKENNIAIRVGVNSGSLPKDLMLRYGMTSEAMVIAAKRYVKKLEDLGFYNIIISLKASIPLLAIKAYELAAKEFKYPLHIGITEAGDYKNGTIKSVAGLAPLIYAGIGDTIRISLTGDPVEEVKVAKKLLNAFDLYDKMVNIIACPTCGRLDFDLVSVVEQVQKYVEDIKKPLRVSILGCAVNGPGEAAESDLGIAGGKNSALLYKKGKYWKTVPQKDIVSESIKAIDEMLAEIK